jgi:erythromycin esterase
MLNTSFERRAGASLRRALATLAPALVLAAACATDAEPTPLSSGPRRLDWSAPYQAEQYAYFDGVLQGRNIILLGESIHMTDELPRARLPIVRYLHEELDFDVLAFEGSAVDAWLAADQMIRSDAVLSQKAEDVRRAALFGLWQTDAMADVLAYVAETQASDRPLYLASFDVQPGSASRFSGDSARALDELFAAIERYEPAPDPDALARWRAAFAPFLSCFRVAEPRSEEEVRAMDRAMAEAASWFEKAAEQVEPAVHGRSLRLVLASLQGTFELCAVQGVRPFGGQTYQRVRDRLNAENAITLRDVVSESGRVMLWAHHSHVNYNTTGERIPSMGEALRRMAGEDVYAIGLFAGSGEAIEADDASDPPLKIQALAEGPVFTVNAELAQLANYDYFLALGEDAALPAGLRERAVGRIEARIPWPMTLSSDYDAVVFIQRVTAPEPFAAMLRQGGKD